MLSVQSDAIRTAILQQYGGIWFDVDTIVTSSAVRNFIDDGAKFTIIGRHLAFIKAEKDSKVLPSWMQAINQHLAFYQEYLQSRSYASKLLLYAKHPILAKRLIKNIGNYNYLGNLAIRKAFRKYRGTNEFRTIDRVESMALPEVVNPTTEDSALNYRHFYFEQDCSEQVLAQTKGIILLHNSWTPEQYRNMNEAEFLNNDNTLANLLKLIL